MRSLAQISLPPALGTPTRFTTKRTYLCWKRQHFSLQTQTRPPSAASRTIRCRATTVTIEEATVPSFPRFDFPGRSTDRHGIGITRFLEGKNYLVSGATGFLAKAFVEKLLRTCPDVGKVYVLIRAKNEEEAKRRLYSDVNIPFINMRTNFFPKGLIECANNITRIIESNVFETLKQTHGESYQDFMGRKLVPVIGNIAEDNLGMDDAIIDVITSQIDIIVNSAASTTLDERYDAALNINAQGPARLLSFGKKCKNLCLFLQFSTVYANGKREGNIAEKSFYNGQSIAGEKMFSKCSPGPFPILDVMSEIEVAKRTSQRYSPEEITPKMKELGQERANLYGWKNSYTLTKAMGEMLLNNNRGDVPIVIVRPSVIESAYKEPYPGWIQGNKVLDPVILMYGKGQLPGFLFDPRVLIDVIPVDMAVNTAIAAMAKHGQAGRPEMNVYHAASSSVNPLSLGQMFDICHDYFTHYPLKSSKGYEAKIKKMEALSSMDDFSAYISRIIADQETAESNGKLHCTLDMKQRRKAECITNVAKLYEPYFFYYGRFDNSNSKNLIKEMSLEEKELFDFDLRDLDWKDYFMNAHIPGIKKHVMKGRC